MENITPRHIFVYGLAIATFVFFAYAIINTLRDKQAKSIIEKNGASATAQIINIYGQRTHGKGEITLELSVRFQTQNNENIVTRLSVKTWQNEIHNYIPGKAIKIKYKENEPTKVVASSG